MQAGHEKTLNGLLPLLSGATTVYGSGMLDLGMAFSLEQLIIDDDLIDMMHYTLKGIAVDQESLSYEAIKNVGIGGDYFADPSTLTLFGTQSDPVLLDRYMLDEWTSNGAKDVPQQAHERLLEITKEHEVVPVERDALKTIQAIANS